MAIDIDKLTQAELIDLNNRVIARLKFLEMRAHASMLEFRIGEKVPAGISTKYNRKSITVITEDGQHWNVAPVFPRKVATTGPPQAASGQVINFQRGSRGPGSTDA